MASPSPILIHSPIQVPFPVTAYSLKLNMELTTLTSLLEHVGLLISLYLEAVAISMDGGRFLIIQAPRHPIVLDMHHCNWIV